MKIYLLILMTVLSTNVRAAECIVSGCSGEICVNKEDASNMMSLCMWKEEFQCYKDHGKCAENDQGDCGWTQTDVLETCLKEKMGLNNNKGNSHE